MNKQELLTRLATECATWQEAEKDLRPFLMSPMYGRWYDAAITKQDWLAERERLLNKPSWKDAPEGAVCMAMYADGWWAFFLESPSRDNEQWIRARWRMAQKAIAIPAGYDWKQSLEERQV